MTHLKILAPRLKKPGNRALTELKETFISLRINRSCASTTKIPNAPQEKTLAVLSSRLDQLKQLDYGSWKGAKFKGEPIPTFAEVAACIPPDKTFVIELKTGPEIVPLLVEQLKQSDLKHEQLLIIAFDSETIAKSKELLPDVRAHWLVGYKQDKKTGQWAPTLDTIAQTLGDCHADGLGTQGELPPW
ncbi:MAG: hypothetical protein R3C56_28960 [Pirellulaceae bacterium]